MMLVASSMYRFRCVTRQSAKVLLNPNPQYTVWSRYVCSTLSSSRKGNAESCSRPKAFTKAVVVPTPEQHIVLVAAWWGAKERHFDKYLQLWQSLGQEQVVGLRPPIATALLPSLVREAGRQYCSEVSHLCSLYPSRPVLLHVFSGAGFVLVSTMMQQAQEQQGATWLSRVSGVVFDSSPADITADITGRALVASALEENVAGVELRHPLLTRGAVRVFQWYLFLPQIQQQLADVQRVWHAVAPVCPQLYLYSDKDPLVTPDSVERFMTQQDQRGCDTLAMKWQDSLHCEHYRTYPEEYRNILTHFMRRLESCGEPPLGE